MSNRAELAHAVRVEAQRQLTRQEATLESVRSRMTALLAASGVVVGLTAKAATGWTVLCAAACLIAIAGLAAITIAPHKLTFDEKLRHWITALADDIDNSAEQFDVRIAEQSVTFKTGNRAVLTKLSYCLWAALTLFVVQVAALAWASH